MGKLYKRFQRPKPVKSYKKVFHILPEGKATEPLYFELIKQKFCDTYVINIHRSNNRTTAKQILKNAKKLISTLKLKKKDRFWIVLDVDRNTRAELEELLRWCEEKSHCKLALSNPSFEYWLLLHFDVGDKVKGKNDCLARLKKYLPNYSKSCLDEKRLWANMKVAISNAKIKYQHCNDWFNDNHTTVFQLIEEFFESR